MDKYELQKSLLITLSGALAVMIFGVVFLSVQQAKTANTLRSAYENSMYNTLDGLSDIECDLGKVMVASSRERKKVLYAKISGTASVTVSQLSTLPISQESLTETGAFLNRLSDYCRYLSERDETRDEKQNITAMYTSCKSLKENLRDLDGMLQNGECFGDTGGEVELYWKDAETNSISYPTLIYDGPFSQNVERGKPIEERAEISVEQAAQLAERLCGQTERGSDLEGDIPCYVFGTDCTVAITKAGGKVMWQSSDGAEGDRITVEQAKEKALEYARNAGFGDMQIVWGSEGEYDVIFNLAPTQDGAVLYPDLVKIKVALFGGKILGCEGRSYIVNNRQRNTLTPLKTVDEAREKVFKGLAIENERLCVAPLFDKEILCYEFIGMYENDRYIVYIDACSLDEVNILRVIKTENGDLAV